MTAPLKGTLQGSLAQWRAHSLVKATTWGDQIMMKRSALLAIFLLCICPILYSQANGNFSGTVTDKTGSVVSGATVKITSQETGLIRDTKTDETGHYLAPLLPVSIYTIRVESQGFQTTEQKNLRLQVDEKREVATRGTYSLSVGGSRAQETDWLFDGVDNNELTAGGIGILPSIDAIQEFRVLTYNYSAEYGTRSGPTVLITTRSGSNKLHGTLFEFFRNTVLDAQDPFASKKDKFNLNQFGGSLGGPLQKDKTFFFADYQGTRKRRGKSFVGLIPTPAMANGDFTLDPYLVARPGSFDGTANADGFADLVNPYATTPWTAFQCDPTTGNPLPAADSNGNQAQGVNCNKILTTGSGAMADPAGFGMLGLYPASNASNPALGFNYTNVPTRKLNEASFDVRLDHNFSNKDSVFARFSYDQANSFVPGGSPGFAEQSAFASTQNISNHGRN